MNKRLVILQSKQDCEEYKKNFFNPQDIVIPIGPDPIFFANKNKMEACFLYELISENENNLERKKSDKKINQLIKDLNKYSKQNYSGNLEIGNYFSFQLKILIDQVLYNLMIVKSIKRKFPSNDLLIFLNKNPSNFRVIRPDPLGLLPEILLNSKLFNREKIQAIKINQFYKPLSLKEFVVFKLSMKLIYLIRNIRDSLRLKRFDFFNSPKSKKLKLALIGGGYEWFDFIQHEEANTRFSIDIVRLFIKKNQNLNKNSISALVKIINENVYKDEIVPYSFDNFARYILSSLYQFEKKSEKFIKILKKYDAVVSSILCFPEENFLAHIANKINLPVILWQHGEKGQSYDDTTFFTEILYASHYFAYGEEVVRQYKHWIGKRNFKYPINVGSIQKDILWEGTNSKKIVYATGKWQLTATGFNEVIDLDSRQYEAQNKILQFLNTDKEWEVFFKANNTEGLNMIPFAEEYENVVFDFKSPFTDLLKKAEIIILDTPATTLIESISTKVPIFVLGGRVKYFDDFINDVKKRVIWCNSPEVLIRKLYEYMKSGFYESNLEDKTYLRNYFSENEKINTIQEVNNSLQSIIKVDE